MTFEIVKIDKVPKMKGARGCYTYPWDQLKTGYCIKFEKSLYNKNLATIAHNWARSKNISITTRSVVENGNKFLYVCRTK